MRAEILAIGSELLEPPREETNGPFLTEQLRAMGIDVVARQTVADERASVTCAFRTALSRADVVIATGGLGPTEDDLTREAAAAALGRGLRQDAAALAALRARFAARGRTMAAVNEKQAGLIDGAVLLPNENGTAPGQRIDVGDQVVFLLPGPPLEMRPMFEAQVRPTLVGRVGANVLRTRVLRTAALPESEVEQLTAPIYKAAPQVRTTILGAAGEVELRLTASGGPEEAAERADALAAQLGAVLGERLYSDDGRTLSQVVGDILRERGLTVAIAESCTGGLLSAELTAVPGASTFFDRAFITYSNRSKAEELAVDATLIESQGAVSKSVALSMAQGARAAARSSYGLGITGIAGPSGATPGKPVGLVYIALAGESLEQVLELRLPGASRERVRTHAAKTALEMLRRALLGLAPLDKP